MLRHTLYYHLKPAVPRRLQIAVRRAVVRHQLRRNRHVWPIDERAATPPEGWKGWPEGKRFALVLTHDVEGPKGLANCRPLMEMEKDLGFRSSFNFVAEGYPLPMDLLCHIKDQGFEVGLHGLSHDGNMFKSKKVFEGQAVRINRYLKEWGAVGFRAPSMYHNLEWISDLDISYDSSTFDTDPFEPQPDALCTIFPRWIPGRDGRRGYVELPCTLPQDFTLFILLRERGIDIWKRKLDWIAERGGMAIVNVHPDYLHFGSGHPGFEAYSAGHYRDFLEHVGSRFGGAYWNPVPKEVADLWIVRSPRQETMGRAPKVSAPESGFRTKADGAPYGRNIWIDLDNTPHVPFFGPIIQELERRGCHLTVTARDCAQTCGLADLFNLSYRRVGRHYGRHKSLKVLGTILRGFQLTKEVKGRHPALALSHGSRAQMVSAWMLRIPSIVVMDYEHVKGFLNPTWLVMPEVISAGYTKHREGRVISYPGIKEDVYVPSFVPDPAIRHELGIGDEDLLVTIRPPATEAHYHNPESETLFDEVVNLLGTVGHVRMVILPRNERQEAQIRNQWRAWCEDGRIVIPQKVLDGLNLLWHSDLVISGGGTMNREAAALGVPVYSIFRGKIGAVDRYLAQSGRLTLLETVEDVHNKLVMRKRSLSSEVRNSDGRALNSIVEGVIRVLEGQTHGHQERTVTY